MTVALTPQIQIANDPFERPAGETIRFSMYKRLMCNFSNRALPDGYTIVPFNESLLPAFSAVTRLSYIKSPELDHYPELGTRKGCNNLVKELTRMQGFRAESSWMVRWNNEPVAIVITRRLPGCVFGEIQLVAVVPRHRRRGLARYLVTRALWSLKDLQVPHASLHVNRGNRNTIRFFRSLGFQVSSSGLYG